MRVSTRLARAGGPRPRPDDRAGRHQPVRLRIAVRWWKRVHWAAYLAWPAAVVHGAGTGTDTSQAWSLGLVLACVGAVVAAAFVRARVMRERLPGRSILVRTTALGGALVFGGWLVAGPLAPGWAARAGTPKPKLTAVSSAVLP